MKQLVMFLLVVELSCSGSFAVQAEQLERSVEAEGEYDSGREESYYDGMEEEWKELDRFLEEELEAEGEDIRFSGVVKDLMRGHTESVGKWIITALRTVLFRETLHGSRLAGQLLALGMVGAVFTGFSDLFSGGQISETGFFLTYLMAFCVMAASFFESIAITCEVLERQVAFMKALMPSYFLAVAWSGASMTSAAWYEVVLLLISAVQWLYWKLLIPLIRVYVLLAMAGHMAREDMLSRMTELLKSGVAWGTRALIGVVLGFQLVQGMVLPYADAAKMTGVQKLLQVIPGVGQGAGAVSKMLLGSGVLIKNTMGAAAVVILLILSLLPIVKLAVLVFLHRSVAAIIQPIADKRLVACISSVAEGQKLLLMLVCSALCLFVITIALICSGTNVSYLA
ncbi:MAG: stage III sporulation protein AE [Lachnospiraceae bacterium]|nr:stage III sporulation protein AE [Lachnospiraceae bacterium]